MAFVNKWILVLLSGSLMACSTSTMPPPVAAIPAPGIVADENLNPTLWVQTSAEYQAINLQIFQASRDRLDRALNDPSWTAATEQQGSFANLPPAIILDIDETCLSHGAYQARLTKNHELHTVPKFVAWLKENKADAIPGAVVFLNDARQLGVTIFFIGNAESEEGARLNLQRLGFPLESSFDNVLMPSDSVEWKKSSNKSSRRAFVASKYRVLFLFGDDLNDFAPTSGLTLAQRAALVRDNASRWGSKWFIIPNPMYGSWERPIVGSPAPSHEEQLRKKYEALDTKE